MYSSKGAVGGRMVAWLGALIIAFPLGQQALAQDIVYQPVNPSFGGNPFNSNHLLGIANAQNDFTNPASSSSNSLRCSSTHCGSISRSPA